MEEEENGVDKGGQQKKGGKHGENPNVEKPGPSRGTNKEEDKDQKRGRRGVATERRGEGGMEEENAYDGEDDEDFEVVTNRGRGRGRGKANEKDDNKDKEGGKENDGTKDMDGNKDQDKDGDKDKEENKSKDKEEDKDKDRNKEQKNNNNNNIVEMKFNCELKNDLIKILDCTNEVRELTAARYRLTGKAKFNLGDKERTVKLLDQINNCLRIVDCKVKNLEIERGMKEKDLRLEEKISSMEVSVNEKFKKMEKMIKASVIKRDKNIETSGTSSESDSGNKNESYASVIGRRNERRNDRMKEVNESNKSREWIPPQPKQEVWIKAGNDSGATIREVRKNLTHIEIGNEGIKRYTRLNGGAIVIECRDQKQKEMIVEKMKAVESVEVREGRKIKPKIKITGIEKGWSEREVMEDIINENVEVKEMVKGQKPEEILRVIRKFTCRNPAKENWIMEARPDVCRKLIEKKRVNVGMMSVYVEAFEDILQCFKCYRFGHIQRNCTNEITCGKCGEKHDTRECRKENERCVNCIRAKRSENVNHEASDRNCPVRKARMDDIKKRIDYGY